MKNTNLAAHLQETLDLHLAGKSQRQIAKELGVAQSTVCERLKRIDAHALTSGGILAAAEAAGVDPTTIPYLWIKVDGASVMTRNPDYVAPAKLDPVSMEKTISDAVAAVFAGKKKVNWKLNPRPLDTSGFLLVIDLADVHIGKLCVESETGIAYDREVAVRRIREGTRELLRKSSGFNVTRILFVIGNDILHIDNSRSTTTSGTFVESHGTLDTMYNDAQFAYVEAIEACAEIADVDVIHCPSNHDWEMGCALAKTIQAWFRNHPQVHVSDYAVSRIHRKYYRYEQNLIGLTHGDGAKEADLPALISHEQRAHWGECQHVYWYIHHLHHKIKKQYGLAKSNREKDGIGITVVGRGSGQAEGESVQVEYLRSPSAPDGWHHRNGYVNRQAVECFLHHPFDGQEARFTAWF